jgi:hypothetical protein
LQTKLGFELKASKPQYGPGESVVLSITLTNQYTKSCRMGGITDGAVIIRSITRNGTPVNPSLTIAQYIDGFEVALVQHLAAVAPGKSLSLLLGSEPSSVVGGRSAFEIITLGAHDDGDVAIWPVDEPGQYVLTASYLFPPLASAPSDVCRLPSDTTSVSFVVS